MKLKSKDEGNAQLRQKNESLPDDWIDQFPNVSVQQKERGSFFPLLVCIAAMVGGFFLARNDNLFWWGVVLTVIGVIATMVVSRERAGLVIGLFFVFAGSFHGFQALNEIISNAPRTQIFKHIILSGIFFYFVPQWIRTDPKKTENATPESEEQRSFFDVPGFRSRSLSRPDKFFGSHHDDHIL